MIVFWAFLANCLFFFLSLVSNIAVYKFGGRLYAVGNLANFNYATSNGIGEKYEVALKLYTEDVVSAP